MMTRIYFQALRAPMAAAMIVSAGIVVPANAAMVPTERVMSREAPTGAATERDDLRVLVLRDEIRTRLQVLGVGPSEALRRIGALSDGEVARLRGDIDHAAAGGVVILLLIIAAVLLHKVHNDNGDPQCPPEESSC